MWLIWHPCHESGYEGIIQTLRLNAAIDIAKIVTAEYLKRVRPQRWIEVTLLFDAVPERSKLHRGTINLEERTGGTAIPNIYSGTNRRHTTRSWNVQSKERVTPSID